MSPSLSSSGAMIARAAVSPPSADGSMSPALIILTSVSVFATSGIFLCVLRRLSSLRAFRSLSARVPIPQGRKNESDPENGQPEMFDAWIEGCIPNSLKWEGYIPFSASVFTDAETKSASGPVRKVGKCRGDGAGEESEGVGNDQGNCCLQVGVLVAMPSPKGYDGVGQELSGNPLRGELAIGLIELPWIEEDHRLLNKIAS